MRIAILAEGTRGDIWPLIALGAQMTLRGHEATVAASKEFGELLDEWLLAAAPIGTGRRR